MITDGDNRIRPQAELTCRQARRQIRAQASLRSQGASGDEGNSLLRSHLLGCARCEAEAGFNRLYRNILEATRPANPGQPEAGPDTAWFRVLRARIEREGVPNSLAGEDSWAAIVWVAARQMVPVMAALVLLIVGATLFWNRAQGLPTGNNDPVLMNQVVEYPQPTTDDVLGTLLAVEDTKNGK